MKEKCEHSAYEKIAKFDGTLYCPECKEHEPSPQLKNIPVTTKEIVNEQTKSQLTPPQPRYRCKEHKVEGCSLCMGYSDIWWEEITSPLPEEWSERFDEQFKSCYAYPFVFDETCNEDVKEFIKTEIRKAEEKWFHIGADHMRALCEEGEEKRLKKIAGEHSNSCVLMGASNACFRCQLNSKLEALKK